MHLIQGVPYKLRSWFCMCKQLFLFKEKKKKQTLLLLGLVSFTSMSNQEHRAVYYSSSNLAKTQKAEKGEPRTKPENGF